MRRGDGGSGRPEYVAVGLVLGAHGTSGAVRVRPLTDFPERLLELDRVRVTRKGPAGRTAWLEVASAEPQGGVFVLAFKGVTDRARAAAMAGSLVEIPVEEVRPLPPGSYYRFQIIGLAVEDERGRSLGRVRDIIDTGANDVYVIVPDGSGGTRDEILVPALKEVVLEIDPDAGRMVVRRPRLWGEPDEV